MIITVTQQPTDDISYFVDWSPFFSVNDGDALSSVDWTSTPSGLTLSGAATTVPDTSAVFVSGGSAGTVYKVTGTMTTAHGCVLSYSFNVGITDQP